MTDETPEYDPLINYPPNDGGETIVSSDRDHDPTTPNPDEEMIEDD